MRSKSRPIRSAFANRSNSRPIRRSRRRSRPKAGQRPHPSNEDDAALLSTGSADGDSGSAVSRLRDGGIEWLFYLWRSDVPELELERIAWSKQAGFLRAAVTFGHPDRTSGIYRSTTAIHLWDLGDAYARGFRPPDGDWTYMMIHIFTHEPLHHAIGRCLAELYDRGDQEWAIARLGDARWW